MTAGALCAVCPGMHTWRGSERVGGLTSGGEAANADVGTAQTLSAGMVVLRQPVLGISLMKTTQTDPEQKRRNRNEKHH